MSHIKETTLKESQQQIIKYLLPKLKDDNVIITVNKFPEFPAAHGYIQVDLVMFGKNILSTSPETLINLGFKIPNTKTLLTLPTGKYKISDLEGKLFNENSELLSSEKHRKSTIQESIYPKYPEKQPFGDCLYNLKHAAKYLIKIGFKKFKIIYGFVSHQDDLKSKMDHWWIELDDGKIVEPSKKYWEYHEMDPKKIIYLKDNRKEYPFNFFEKITEKYINISREIITEKHKRPDGKKARSFIAVFRYNPSVEVLLVSDKKGRWTLPGGQLDMKENYEDAAWRELKEETGVVPKDLIHWKKIEGDDKITDIYYTVVPSTQQAKAGSDASGVKWASIDKLDGVKNFHRIVLDDLTKDIHNTKKELEESIKFLESIGISSKELLTERKRTVDGYLIIMEGIDGAGKSTQCDALEKWLRDKGWKVTISKWNSSPHITDAIKKGKKERWLSPTLFSLLNASDMVWRYENVIKPALDKGHVVICDRFYYTSYVRDSLRGVPDALLNEIYKNFPEPDLVIHFIVPPELAMERLMKDKGVKYYSAGRDIGYHEDEEKCALEYETKMDEVYRKILPKIKNYKAINSERKPSIVFKEIKSFVKGKLQKVKRSKFKNLIKETVENGNLNERLTYRDLYDATDDERIDKARTVRARPLVVTTENNNEMWKFSYTSAERSEYKKYGGNVGHKGNIHFFKDSIEPGDNVEDLDCMVDCDCRDFKFRWAYANAQDDASFIGGKSLNKAINRPPIKTNPNRKTQLCKHLAGLAKYLTTNIDRARQRARLRRRPVNIFEEMDNLANKGKFKATYNDYKDLNESVLNEDLYEYFYHATTVEALPSIVKLGLIPSTNTNWGGDLGAYSRGKIFITKEFPTANYYGNIIWRNDPNHYRPILRFKYNKHRLIPDKNSSVDFYVQYPLKGKFEIFVYNENTKVEIDKKTGDTWFDEKTGNWRPLTLDIADGIYHGEWDDEIIDDEDQEGLYENIERIGYDPDEEHSEMPIDWNCSDVQMCRKWDIPTIREFVGLSPNFTAIYPAIIDTNQLNPKLAEDDDDIPEDERGGFDWEEFRIKRHGFPPVLVMRDEQGKLHLMDGNHRTHWAQQNGYQTIGAWVVDKLVQKHINRQNKKSLKETRIISPELSLEEGYITLYHGTIWPIALQAKKGELGPQNLKKLVADVLINVFHETSQTALKYYDDEIKHHSIRNDPSQNLLFLTTDKEAATRYAKSSTKYGGEIFLDILGQYLWDKQGKLGQDITELAKQHLLTDEPAVVTVNVPLSMVFTHPNWNTPYRGRIRDILKNTRKHPELKKHLDNLNIEVFVKEKIPARFVQRIDKVEKFGEEDR